VSTGTGEDRAEATGAPRRLGIVGTLVWDTIWTLEDLERGTPFHSWGGIGYSLAAAAAARPEGWEIVPIVKVGRDLESEARDFLASLPGVSVGPSVRVVPERNNRVELRYLSPSHRDESQSGAIPGWSWDELAPHLEGLDALFVNFISGCELALPAAEALRRSYSGLLYTDLHSLFLGPPGAGARERRLLPDWERWAACFDVVQLNEEELRTLDPAEPGILELARRLAEGASGPSGGPGLVLVTQGAAGASFLSLGRGPGGPPRSGYVPVPGGGIEGDPTGSGDVWGATLVCGLAAGLPVEDTILRAHRAAARKMGVRGASELYAHLASAPPP